MWENGVSYAGNYRQGEEGFLSWPCFGIFGELEPPGCHRWVGMAHFFADVAWEVEEMEAESGRWGMKMVNAMDVR